MAEKSHGIKFYWSTDGGTTEYNVAELVDITVPSITKDTIEITNHASGGIREYMGGLVDFGEVSVTVNYNYEDGDAGTAATDSNHRGLRALTEVAFDKTTDREFKIEFPDGADTNTTLETQTFTGIVTGFEMETPIDDVVKATFTIKVSGSVTYSDDNVS